MAYMTSPRPAPFGAFTTLRVLQMLRTLRGLPASLRARHAVNAMTQRELNDLGLVRREIVRKTYSPLSARF